MPVIRAVHQSAPPSMITASVAAMPTGRAFGESWTVRARRYSAATAIDRDDEPPELRPVDQPPAGEVDRGGQQHEAHHLLEQLRPRPAARELLRQLRRRAEDQVRQRHADADQQHRRHADVRRLRRRPEQQPGEQRGGAGRREDRGEGAEDEVPAERVLARVDGVERRSAA